MAAKQKSAVGPNSLSRIFIACFLAWVVPGAGHLYLRRYAHAAIFFLIVTALVTSGWLISGEMHSLLRPNSGEGLLQFLAAVGNIALGSIHLIFLLLGWAPGGMEYSSQRTYEYGTTFIIVAALINILVMLDAFDHARGARK